MPESFTRATLGDKLSHEITELWNWGSGMVRPALSFCSQRKGDPAEIIIIIIV
jgi:hypothetical protein